MERTMSINLSKRVNLMAKVLSFEEFMKLARINYSVGGVEFFDSWDEGYFNFVSEDLGGITKSQAKKMFKTRHKAQKALLETTCRIFARR